MKRILILLALLAMVGCSHSDSKIVDQLTTSLPENGTTWSYSSKQKITWSVPTVPEGTYNLVFYLENEKTQEKGYIYSEPLTKPEGEINYVANAFIKKDGKVVSLPNGTYQLTVAAYETKAKTDYGYGKPEDLIAEKTIGDITIQNSDVAPTTGNK